MSIIRSTLQAMIRDAVHSLLIPMETDTQIPDEIELDIPKHAAHGDYATNIAMVLAKVLRRNPREIASSLVQRIEDPESLVEKIDIAGPGFINFFLRPSAWFKIPAHIHQHGRDYGKQNLGMGIKVQVEFVSANPTGPLHIGHGRGAAVGDVLANIFEVCGYHVDREYYINDAGKQMETLGRSVYLRYLEGFGKKIDFPEDHYQGDYIKSLARDFAAEKGDRYLGKNESEVLDAFTRYASERILKGIRDDLDAFGVTFDVWFSERNLHEAGAIEKTIEDLKREGFIYEKDGALWFRSSHFGDEKDRVVVRANGISTYFASDLAYHRDKFRRGYDRVIDIWGADHHGYIPRMEAGILALGRQRGDLRVILVQLVNLLRAGEPVAMSTRKGEFVTLRDVIDEVGKDAARFIFLTRRSDSHLDFDLEVATMKNNDNPVFYVQYAHARLCSVFEVARERGVTTQWQEPPDLGLLREPQELALMKLLGEYPDILANAARYLEPHRIPYYLHDLVSLFHSYYNRNRILGSDPHLTQARLYLAGALKIVLRNALTILGVAAPEKM